MMNGTLFKYGPGSAHVAFKSAPPPTLPAPRPASPGARTGELHLVLVGGLTDGLLFAPYAQQLAAAAADLGWCLVQAQLSSSNQGWGLASLDGDAAELHLLSQHLREHHSSRGWVLMGHSTGCQDAVRYAQRYGASDPSLAAVILQAPVSDREYLQTFPAWQDKVPLAQQLVQAGHGEEVVHRVMKWDGSAVTARRLVSLCCAIGEQDDMFSTDLSLQQLQLILGPLRDTPCLILQSGADESVPEALLQSGAVQQLGQRMLQAIKLGCSSTPPPQQQQPSTTAAADAESEGVASVLQQLRVIEGAGHACAGHEEQLVAAVCDFLAELPAR